MNIWGIILLSLAFLAFFSGMEIAYVTAKKLKVDVNRKSEGLSARIISKLTRSDFGYISTMMAGNNVALVIYGIAMAILLEGFLRDFLPVRVQSDFVILSLQTIVSSVIVLVFAEFFPKILFRINSNGILNFFAMPVLILYYTLYPVIFITIGISEFILRNLFNIKIVAQPRTFDAIYIDNFFREFGSSNPENKDRSIELQMFRNAIEFRDIKLRESMIPRTEIVAIEESESLEKCKDKFSEKGLSKILIYRQNTDNIIGYVHAFDFFKKPTSIQSIIRPITLVPETMHVNKLFKDFIQQRKSIAVVVDEFGGTSGLITLEDIMEEIFGEIDDEHDTDNLVEKTLNPGEFIFSARLEIDYLNKEFGFDLPESDEYETLGGLIINQYESIPSKDEVITVKNYTFRILQVSQKRIEQVHMKVIDLY